MEWSSPFKKETVLITWPKSLKECLHAHNVVNTNINVQKETSNYCPILEIRDFMGCIIYMPE
jgi:hypothetical protein